MKKIIIFILFILLTGCSADYTLTYNDNILNEELKIINSEGELCGETLCNVLINDFYHNNISIYYYDDDEELAKGVNLDNYMFYNKNYNDNILKLNYAFNKDDYKNSRVGNSLFNYIYVNDYKIIASGIKDVFSNYTFLNNIKISFQTDKAVLETNSDSEENGVYYWNINIDNYKDKNIEIRFDYQKNNDTLKIENGYISPAIIKYIIMFIVIIILISIIIIYEKVKKSND